MKLENLLEFQTKSNNIIFIHKKPKPLQNIELS